MKSTSSFLAMLPDKLIGSTLLFMWLGLYLIGCTQPHDVVEHTPVLSPEEEQATFHLADGLRIELVAAEPLVQDPVVITFDPDGRLWVVEMRGFMPDIDGTGEDAPVGRISVLTDDDGDGRMDTGTVFLDSLILPRSIALVPGGALVAEHKPLWFVADTDGDLRADSKTLIDPEYGGSGLPEHSGNGLWRGLDNWYYNAKSSSRYRFIDNQWVRDETEFRGQWGLSHDDDGRLYYNYNWSQLHVDLVPPNYLSRNVHHTPTSGIDVGIALNRSVYPARPTPAVNRGYIPGSLDDQNRLLEFTSASAPLVYRGTALPPEYAGNAFVCEPAGNLIKRNLVDAGGLSVTSRFAYPDREFLAATDERFRPVSLATGPDGALYVVDMYRGIIQHGAYMTDYLREQTLERGLDRHINLGRIWRIVPEDWTQPESIALGNASSDALIERLSHPDGWHRDTAQRLLVERQDPATIPALETLARSGTDYRSRLHALWTLEGLGAGASDVYFDALDDPHPRIRTTALRLLEEPTRSNPTVRNRLETELLRLGPTAPAEVAMQIALTAGSIDVAPLLPLLADIAERFAETAVIRDAVMSSIQDFEYALLQHLWSAPDWQSIQPGKAIFLETLATAVTRKGDPEELAELLALLDTNGASFTWRETAVVNGLAVRAGERGTAPIRLASAPTVLSDTDGFEPGMQRSLQRVASMFEWPGHTAVVQTVTEQTLLDEEDQKRFAEGRQHYLTVCAGCHGNDGSGLNSFAPPLIDSEWVLGDEVRLVRLLLHGLEGPIEVNGHLYQAPEILPVMPSFAPMDDAELAAVITYIRHAWGHNAEPVSPRTVGRTRHTSQGRVVPWTPEELLEQSASPDSD